VDRAEARTRCPVAAPGQSWDGAERRKQRRRSAIRAGGTLGRRRDDRTWCLLPMPQTRVFPLKPASAIVRVMNRGHHVATGVRQPTIASPWSSSLSSCSAVWGSGEFTQGVSPKDARAGARQRTRRGQASPLGTRRASPWPLRAIPAPTATPTCSLARPDWTTAERMPGGTYLVRGTSRPTSGPLADATALLGGAAVGDRAAGPSQRAEISTPTGSQIS
jgi:hypothetical protein